VSQGGGDREMVSPEFMELANAFKAKVAESVKWRDQDDRKSAPV
jgi:hypothetical protein